MQIIESLLDTDLYKFSMCQCYLHQFPNVTAKFEFKCRNKGVNLSPYFDEIQKELLNLEGMVFSTDELDYLASIRFLKPDFIEFLRGFQLQPKKYLVMSRRPFKIETRTDTPIIQASMFEIFTLSIVNEIYFRMTEPNPDYRGATALLYGKIKLVKDSKWPIRFSEFGTRRRRSKHLQRRVLDVLKTKLPSANFLGTSNVMYAKEFGLRPMGTMAHEFLCAAQALTFLPDAQRWALDTWMREYQGNLGIALSDVWGMEAFRTDFNLLYAKAYDGARHDSGDPFNWGNKLIAHYKKLGIDPRTKSAVFTDSLTFPRAKELAKVFGDRINVSFGIGTNLLNDFPDSEPLNIVMKMTECNGWPVAKLSDSPGKTMCQNKPFMNYLNQVIDQKIKGGTK